MRWIVAGLLALIVVQVGVSFAHNTQVRHELEVGDHIPISLHSVDGTTPFPERGSCSTLYVCSVNCPGCRSRAANRNYHLNANPEAVERWVILGDRRQAQAFGESHGIPPEMIGFTRPRGIQSFFFPRYLHVPATPLRIVVDPRGVVRDVSIDHRLPSVEEMLELCRD